MGVFSKFAKYFENTFRKKISRRLLLHCKFCTIYVDNFLACTFWSWFWTKSKKCPYSELFWSVFSRIRTKYKEIRSTSPYSARMRENADQNNSEYGHFSRSGKYPNFLKCYNDQVVYPIFLGKGKKYSPSRNISILPKIWKIVKFVSSCNHCHYSVWKPYL